MVIRRPRLDPEQLRPFLDPDAIIGRARRLAERGNLSERQRTAVHQFVQEYEARQQSIDPDSPAYDLFHVGDET